MGTTRVTPRVVFDTNVLISGLVFNGKAEQCFDLARTGEVTYYATPPTLRELRRVLGYDRLNLSDSEQADHFAMATTTATVVAPTEDITEIEADPDDDMFLECASAADADYLISGDTHLLDLGSFQGIPVLSPDEFLREWGK